MKKRIKKKVKMKEGGKKWKEDKHLSILEA
jgi:hypothetical protein